MNWVTKWVTLEIGGLEVPSFLYFLLTVSLLSERSCVRIASGALAKATSHAKKDT